MDEWLAHDQPAPGLLQQFRHHRPVGPSLFALALIALALVVIPSGRTSKSQGAATPSAGSLTPWLGYDPATAYDATRRQVVLLNQAGQTWLWANQTWTLAHPAGSPPTGFDVAAWDPGMGRVLLVGVVGEASEFTYTYAWDGTTWTKLHPAVVPPAGALSMAYDATGRQMVLLVGSGGASGTIEVETWVFDGDRWLRRSSLDSSRLSVSTAIGFDAFSHTLLAVASNFAASGTSTWRWDVAGWHLLTPSHSPPPSAHMTLVNQPGSGRLLLLTGADAPFGSPTVTQTWTWNGRDWAEHAPLGDDDVIPYAVTAAADGIHGTLWAFEEVPPRTTYALSSVAAFRWSGAGWEHMSITRVAATR